MKNLRRQRGSAVITAIFVVALVAIISTSIAWISHHLVKQAIANREHTRSQFILDTPIHLVENAFDQPDPPYSGIGFKTKKEGVLIRSYATSPQQLLNINMYTNLTDSEREKAENNLSLFLKTIGIKQSPARIANLLISTLNHKIIASGDKIDLYQWPGFPLTQRSALRAIPGVTKKTYQILRDWIVALPAGAKHLPNSAHWPILIALGLSEESASKVARCLESYPKLDPSRAMSSCKLPLSSIPSWALSKITNANQVSYIDVNSYYFSGKREYSTTTRLYRENYNQLNRWHRVWRHNDINE